MNRTVISLTAISMVAFGTVSLYVPAKHGLHEITKDLGVEQTWLDVPDDQEIPSPAPGFLFVALGFCATQIPAASGRRKRDQNPQPKHRKP